MSARKKNLLDGVIYFFNVLAALGILCSYLSYYFNPNWFTFFAFAGLAYPILLLLNLLFIIYWLLRLRLKFMLSLICIGIGYFHIGRLYQWSADHKEVREDTRLKIMTYNVRMFNAYEWIAEEDIPQRIYQTIQHEEPDVLMIQEYYDYEKTPRFDYPYEFARYTNDGRNYGLKIYSAFPIVGSGTLSYTEGNDIPVVNNEFIYADIQWQGKIIRFIDIHLASIGLGANDYKRLEKPNEGSQEEIASGFLQILKRLHWAFQRRGEQIEAVEKAIQDSPYPVVLTGDLNDTPQSYTYHRINLELKDAFIEAGTGFGETYARGPLPFRIDHIFHSPEIKAYNYHVIKKKLSDHYPVVVELEMK